MIFPTFGQRASVPGPGNDFWYYPVGAPTKSGTRVSEPTALRYLTVYACVTLIAQDIARVPLQLFRRIKPMGKEIVTDHPLADVLHSLSNPDTTSFMFRETGMGQLLLWGNAFSLVDRNDQGDVTGLWQIPDPNTMRLHRRDDGTLFYEHVNPNGKRRFLRKDQVFHIANYSFNGLLGMSPVALAREAIGLGLSAEEFGQRFFGQGTHPAGVMEMDGDLGDARQDYVEGLKKQYAGLGKSHSIMLLERGAKYKPLTMPLEDAQFLETRDHQKVEICGMYKVPPHKIALHGQNSNYSNLEQENGSYVDSCITPWVTRWETSISAQLLTREDRMAGLFAEFNLDGLLRGDSAARADYYSKMMGLAAITPDEIRNKENMNAIPGGAGEQHFVMANLLPIDASRDQNKTAPPGDEQIANVNAGDEFKFMLGGPELEKRSIAVRDRISQRYHGLIHNAAVSIVNRESKTVAAKARKLGSNTSAFRDWLVGFYADEFRQFAGARIGPVFRTFMDSILSESFDEIGTEYDPEEFEQLTNDYVAGYLSRHAGSSEGQLNSLSSDEDGAALVIERTDEWREKRPDKIANNETVRAAGAAFTAAVFSAGLAVVWRIRGSHTCQYCRKLEGRRIRSGSAFVEIGDEIKNPDDPNNPMRIKTKTQHPPLHQGCDCTVTAF